MVYCHGMVLIGLPGLEKRSARYPQLYSRIGFVHEFKPLSQADVRQLLREGSGPSDISLTDERLIDEESLAILIRTAEGRFRLLYRLFQQINRVLEINKLDRATAPRRIGVAYQLHELDDPGDWFADAGSAHQTFRLDCQAIRFYTPRWPWHHGCGVK